MKKYGILVTTTIFCILQLLNKWYADELLEKLFILYIFVEGIIFVIFVTLLIFLSISFVKNKSVIDAISLILLTIMALMTLFFPFRETKTKVELKLFEEDRAKVIEMVKNNELIVDGNGNAKLPEEYKKVSNSGEISVYQNDESGIVIGFWIFRGMQSGSVELIYSTGGEQLIKANETGHPIISIEELKKDWFYVITDY